MSNPYKWNWILKSGFAIGGLYAAVLGIKVWFQSRYYTGKGKLLGTTVIVTGATSGIGEATAKEMAKRGAEVILACRNMHLCEERRNKILSDTFNRKVHCASLDLSSQTSVIEFAKNLAHPADVVILNAGVMSAFAKRQDSDDAIEMNFAVNFIGNFLLTTQLLSQQKLKPKARIVGVVCEDAWHGTIDWDDINSSVFDARKAYKQSKLAEAMFLLELSDRLAASKSEITVGLVDPKKTFTSLFRSLPYNNFPPSKFAYSFYNQLMYRQPWQSCQAVLNCAINTDLCSSSGKLFRDFDEIDIPKVAVSPTDRQKLFLLAEKWTRKARETSEH